MSERHVRCPVCVGHKEDPCYVNTAKRVGYCHRCHTGWSGKAAMKLLGPTDITSTGSKVLPSFERLMDAWEVDDARYFLYGRGVTPDVCPLVEYNPESNRLYFRIWSPSPEFSASYTTRPVAPKGFWSVEAATRRRHYVFGWVDESPSDICLVEGVWDALKLGRNAVALLGTTLTSTHLSWLRSMKSRPRVHVFMDRDPVDPQRPHILPPGQAAEKKLCETLHFYGFTVEQHPEMDKEPGDYSYDDPALVGLRGVLSA